MPMTSARDLPPVLCQPEGFEDLAGQDTVDLVSAPGPGPSIRLINQKATCSAPSGAGARVAISGDRLPCLVSIETISGVGREPLNGRPYGQMRGQGSPVEPSLKAALSRARLSGISSHSHRRIHSLDSAIRPTAVSCRPVVRSGAKKCRLRNAVLNGGQPGQHDAHSPEAGGYRAQQGAPMVAVEARWTSEQGQRGGRLAEAQATHR